MKRYFSTFVLGVVLNGYAAAQTGTAVLLQQSTYPPVSLVSGQTLRLNLANVSGAGSTCIANLSFVNSDGTTIKNGDVKVASDQSTSYTMQYSEITGASITAVVRAVVKVQRQVGGIVLPPGQSIAPSCTSVTSLELVDTTGQTRFLLTNPTSISGGFAIPLPIVNSVPPTAVSKP